MEFLGREARDWVLSLLSLVNGGVGVLWAISTARRAKEETGPLTWPCSWKWVAAIRELVLALFFLLVAVFIFFDLYDWRAYGIALGIVAVMKLYVLRRWLILDFPPEVPRPEGNRGRLVERIDQLAIGGILVVIGALIGAIVS